MTIPIVLDTDIGTDIDDTIALTTMLGSSRLQPVGITTVYVDAVLRARLARDLLARAGVEVTVSPGESVPIRPVAALRERGIWEWHEGRGVLYDDISREEREYIAGTRPFERPYVPNPESEASARMAALAEEHPGLVVVCIGPLTNLATTLRRYPDFEQSIAGVTLMGGWFEAGAAQPRIEHNFESDPGAVEVVFRSDLPLTVVSFDATEACYLVHERASVECSTNTPLSKALSRLIDIYFEVKHRWRTSMHDPVAVAVAEDPTIGGLTPTTIYLDPATGGTALEPFSGAIAKKVLLSTAVLTEQCESLIYERLRRACSNGGR